MSLGTLKGATVTADLWIPVADVKSSALSQLRNIASLPWVARLAVMPDVHFGIGATVGSVIAMRGAVAPAAVGVDIGCGMAAVPTNLKASDLPESLRALRLAIEAAIPVGFNGHSGFAMNGPNAASVKRDREADSIAQDVSRLFGEFHLLNAGVQSNFDKATNQCGTLGGGNHFIEVCLDTDDTVWLMLHSGSRNIGKELAEIHMSKAQKLEHNQALEDRKLSVFLAGTQEMKDYRHDLFWAQRYAMLNRRVMLLLLRSVVRGFFPQVQFGTAVMCHHNYVSEENHFGEDLVVTRKGAISAQKGEMGIIPGSMGTKSYIVRGLGNAEALCSASHGAGRRMSRGAAKKSFTEADLASQTSGVECRKDSGVLDEIPGAYKDIDQVMENQKDLVETVAVLKQIICVKG